MELKLGFMSPDGKFYECEYYGHLDLAEKICEETGLIQELKELSLLNKYVSRLDCENFLVAKGYLEICSRNASHSCEYMRGVSVMDERIPRVNLSDIQKVFLKDNLENAWNEELCDSMYHILRWNEES